MAEQRMSHRIWADPDRWHPGMWIGRFSTARGIRSVPDPLPSIEAAKIAAGEMLCEELDEMAEQAITLPITPTRGSPRFAVTKHGRHKRAYRVG